MAFLLLVIWTFCICNVVSSFNLGITRTACSNSDTANNNLCDGLYAAICDGAHCKCPPGTVENNILMKCKKRLTKPFDHRSPSNGMDDLPFDYIPNQKPKQKSIIFPDGSIAGRSEPGWKTTNKTEPYKYPNNVKSSSNSSSLFPNEPGYNADKGGYPSGTKTNIAGGYPTSIESYGGHGHHRNNHYDNHMGRNTGGGIGGGLSLLILVLLIYFCCCRGEKGKNFRGRLPFGNRSVVEMNGVTYHTQQIPMQQPTQPIYLPQQPNQQMYVPQQPGNVYVAQQPGHIYPPQQPGQIYPPQQPAQIYPPQQPAANMYYPPPQPGQFNVSPPTGKQPIPQVQPPSIGFASPPPPYTAEYIATAPPPTG